MELATEKSKKLEVIEIFKSINGEGMRAGELTTFVRFKGCNLKCAYCDTSWANKKDAECHEMTVKEIANVIEKHQIANVTLTGGEPLLQKDITELVGEITKKKLKNKSFQVPGFRVEIETNGAVSIAEIDAYRKRKGLNEQVRLTLDYKLPSSGMEDKMISDNFDRGNLTKRDSVKFVCSDRADLERAVEVIKRYRLTDKCYVIFSPVYGKIDPKEIVEFMKEHKLNGVRIQLQLHKFIWDPDERGV
ncbi:MAG: putative 7-carboxy-7-deazaguanine synthase QueE [Parasporobacterium sp.]|nr:putative 7-carboxy-7-deazaguanine synthase QueE [Parasporobacterium sp.]